MAETRTEALHQNAEGLDIQAPDAILASLADAQIEAAKVVRQAIPVDRQGSRDHRRQAEERRQACLRGSRQLRPDGAGRCA